MTYLLTAEIMSAVASFPLLESVPPPPALGRFLVSEVADWEAVELEGGEEGEEEEEVEGGD